MRKSLLIPLLAVVVPAAAQAHVRINEIAWMGTEDSANAEWVELANPGDTTADISGWSLRSGDGSPHIVFPHGSTISAHGYYLLERTRDGAVPGVSADLIYTGSLSNSGETLTLKNSASTTVDTVVGGKKWCSVGGDNTTKETAQYTSAGWITATATPRAANATSGTPAACGSTSDTATTHATSTAATSSTSTTTTTTNGNTTSGAPASHTDGPPAYEPIPTVLLNIGPDRSIVAGADVKFSALVTDGKGHEYKDAKVHWAFGDGSATNSTSIFKSFRAPGSYLVTANAIEGLGSGEDDMTVTVRSADVRVASVTPKGITLANDDAHRLDLSYWKLRAGTTTYALPAGTKMLPHTTVLFPDGITGLSYATDSALLYPDGKTAASPGVVRGVTVATTHVTEPAKPKESSHIVQRTSSAARATIATSISKTSAHENSTVVAPAGLAKVSVAGAPLVSSTSVHTSANTNKAHRSFFTSPVNVSLAGVLAVASIALVVL